MPIQVSPTKGRSPRFPVLSQVHLYEHAAGVLLTHMYAHNRMDIRNTRAMASLMVQSFFEKCMREVSRREPGEHSKLEVCLRFNDSVSALRTAHNRVLIRIREWRRGEEL